MPIYEYQCDACASRFEALQKLGEEPLQMCTLCGAGPVNKLVSTPSFRLKGSGWYETDFKKSGQRNLAGRDEAAAATTDSDSKSPAKSDTASGDSAASASASSSSASGD